MYIGKPESDVNIGRQHPRLQPDVEGEAPRHSGQQQLSLGEDDPATLWPEARLKGMPRELAKG